MQDKINELSQKLGLPVKKINDIFYYLRDGLKIDNLELIRKTGIAKNTINSVKDYFKEVFGSASTTTQLDKKLISELDGIFTGNYLPDENLLNLAVNSDTQDVFSERVAPLREYDQFTATPETVVKKIDNKFEPVGRTLVYVLSESHLAIHTWPEYNTLHIDLVSCKDTTVSDFDRVLAHALKELKVVDYKSESHRI